LKRKQGDSIKEDEDGEALHMLKNVPLKKQNGFNKKRHPRRQSKHKLKKKKMGKIGLMEMLRFSLLFVGNGTRICEKWQKTRLELETPNLLNIHNKTCKSCFKSLYMFCFEFSKSKLLSLHVTIFLKI
jgi:hypothetical protein